GVPARIDRSVWGQRYSGSSGTQLMTALKVLDLVDDEGRPAETLERLVRAEGDARRRALRAVLEAHYAPVFALDLSRATRAQFHEAFRSFGTKEGVLAKCEAFFIRAAQDAGIELSAFVLARRHVTRRAGAAPRGRTQAAERAGEAPLPDSGGRRAIAQMILAKYPQFDPSWAPEVQARWLEGITKLYEGLSTGEPTAAEAGSAD
ncbi:MAG: DUF5343 domain-containing protein, partial [Gemmatimonadetes bacterium]|nr:DUF5343 domain-containing protein [Gemmatimonadota bacterium]